MYTPGIVAGLALICLGFGILVFHTIATQQTPETDLTTGVSKADVGMGLAEFRWPFSNNRPSKHASEHTLPFRKQIVHYRGSQLIELIALELDDLTLVQLDTGSANLVVGKNADTQSKHTQCQTLTYGSGSVYACLGNVRVENTRRKKETLAAEVVLRKKSFGDLVMNENIVGLMPGSDDNQTSIVRQLDLATIEIDFLAERLFLSSIESSPASGAIVHPGLLLSLVVAPWKVTWHWSNGKNVIWKQWFDDSVRRVRSTVVQNDQSNRTSVDGPPILFYLDTGTTDDLVRLGGGGVDDESRRSADEENVICTHVSLTIPTFSQAEFHTSLSAHFQNIEEYLFLPLDQKGKPRQTTTYRFSLLPIFQQIGRTRIPNLSSSSASLRLILGINALVKSYPRMAITFEPLSKVPRSISFFE